MIQHVLIKACEQGFQKCVLGVRPSKPSHADIVFLFCFVLVQLGHIFSQCEGTGTPCRTGDSPVLFVGALIQWSKIRLEEIFVYKQSDF